MFTPLRPRFGVARLLRREPEVASLGAGRHLRPPSGILADARRSGAEAQFLDASSQLLAIS